ncbi:LCP family protein [Patescibacteria group bacterium]|nr:LCP family protein [Patescibacteria group bacterium]
MKQNFLDLEENEIQSPPEPRKKKFSWRKLFIYLTVILILLVVVFLYDIISSGKSLSESLGQAGIWQQFRHLITSEERKISGEADDRINAIIMGIGGIEHEGPYLADTIIFASFKPSTKQVAMISIPRDFVAELPGFGWYKINSANAYSEAKNPGSGGEFTSQVVSKIFDLDVHYYITVDFKGFIEIIDDLGGVIINVERTFDDFKYPIPGMQTATTTLRYEHLHFDSGRQHMEGEEALRYARSRMADGVEGSDYARAKRQQNVIVAVKEKVFSWQTLVNPYRISRLMENLGNHIRTNAEVWEIYQVYQLAKDMPSEDISHFVLSDAPDNYLVPDITEDGAFVLRPKAGDYSQLRLLAQNIFELALDTVTESDKIENPSTSSGQEKPKIIAKNKLNLEIQNGTWTAGLAGQTLNKLEKQGFTVITVGNARTQDYDKTFIYDLSPQIEKDIYLEELENYFDVDISSSLPGWVKSSQYVNAASDILIILGSDYSY